MTGRVRVTGQKHRGHTAPRGAQDRVPSWPSLPELPHVSGGCRRALQCGLNVSDAGVPVQRPLCPQGEEGPTAPRPTGSRPRHCPADVHSRGPLENSLGSPRPVRLHTGSVAFSRYVTGRVCTCPAACGRALGGGPGRRSGGCCADLSSEAREPAEAAGLLRACPVWAHDAAVFSRTTWTCKCRQRRRRCRPPSSAAGHPPSEPLGSGLGARGPGEGRHTPGKPVTRPSDFQRPGLFSDLGLQLKASGLAACYGKLLQQGEFAGFSCPRRTLGSE